MLKQSPVRAQRSKGYKVKHVLQACVLLILSIWLLNQLKHSFYDNAEEQQGAEDASGKEEAALELLKLGRKDIRPRVDDIERGGDKEEVEEEVDEIKPEEMEDEGRGGGDDEVDGHDLERPDEEPEEVEDLIDVDDRDREEASELQEIDEKDKPLEDGSSEANRDENEDKNIARTERWKGDSTDSMEQGIHIVTSKPETMSMRKMKETEDLEIELVLMENSSNDSDGAIDSDPKSQKNVTAEPIPDPNSLDEANSGILEHWMPKELGFKNHQKESDPSSSF